MLLAIHQNYINARVLSFDVCQYLLRIQITEPAVEQ